MINKRQWLVLCSGAAWLLALGTGGAKAGGSLIVVEILILASLGAWLTLEKDLPRESWTAPLAGFVLWLPVSLLGPGLFQKGLQGILELLSVSGFFFLARYLWNEKEQELFVVSIHCAAFLNAVMVLVQAHMSKDLTGLFPGNHNYSAILTATACLLILFRFLKKISVVPGLCLAVMLWSLTLQKSRGAWLGFWVGSLILAHQLRGWRGVFGLMSALTFWFVCLPGNYIFELSKLGEGSSALARPLIWKSALHMIRQHPLTGWGPGNFEQGFRLNPVECRDGLFWYEKSTAFAHSGPLQIAAELGLPALFFFLWSLRKFWRDAGNDAGARALLAAFFIEGAFDMTFYLPALKLLWVGLAATTKSREKVHAKLSPSWTAAGFGFLIASLALLSMTHWPMGSASWQARAKALHETGNLRDPETLQEIEKSYQEAIKMNPSDPWLWQERAHFLGWHCPRNRWGEALLSFEKAKDLNTFHAPLYCQVGEMSLAHGDAPRAREEFKRCLELEPHALRAWKGLTATLRALGRDREAGALETSLVVYSKGIMRNAEKRRHGLSNYALYLLGLV